VTRGSARLKKGQATVTAKNKRKAGSVLNEEDSKDVAEKPAKKTKKGEPTFCVCRDVEYGTMVQCDDKNVRKTHAS